MLVLTLVRSLTLHSLRFSSHAFAHPSHYKGLSFICINKTTFRGSVQHEHRVFVNLIDSYPGLLDHLTKGEEEDVIHIGELLGDDTKTLKSAVLEWLVPRGQAGIPPLSQNIKSDRGFNHKVTGLDWSNAEYNQAESKEQRNTVHSDQWPMFLYAGYDYDPKDPWKGLLQSEILVFGFKHIFRSPSSVDKEPKATRSGNAYLHSMNFVTQASLAYVATQVWFLLSSSSVFSHTDTVTDSEKFYHSILDLLEDLDESEEVADLMTWWTQFRSISKNSALSKIQEKRTALQERVAASTN
ncbi:hypothetical protein DFJ58DRAFT_719467 [Suillus subalutaceus]|uniref:uncharacterized protein n=1 Tax=Suillus subalutaceus TaxID=48586 RepID=UPI001B883C44|nr:uncharacterized protein DFJ58DRAFT_719467 [Suillus subalutaceus]KAG1833199.1 hypothetical protein DFJ58DRAFT_719467 [Suillus subalutaceus]